MVPAIVVFAYNRPAHLQWLFESLKNSRNIEKLPLYVFVDGPRNFQDEDKISQTIAVIEKYSKYFDFKKIVTRPHNIGLSLSIIEGVSEVISMHEGVIVLEDDIQLAPSFIDFMIANLSKYQNSQNIGSVTGYQYAKGPFWRRNQNYISLRQSSWAWGTWRDRWEKIDWKILDENAERFELLQKKMYRIGEDLPRMMVLARAKSIDSWSIVFDANAANYSWKCLHPAYSLAINNGFDGSGTHYSSIRVNMAQPKTITWNFPSDLTDLSGKESKLYDAEVWFRNSSFSRFYLKPFVFIKKVFKKSAGTYIKR
jgi:hypothetical protein